MSKETKERKVVMPPKDKLIEKWLPIIKAEGEYAEKLGDVPVVEEKNYEMLATSLEVLAQTQLDEATVSGDVAQWTPVLIPMLRRIQPALIGPELFGTQPLSTPSGLIFALKSSYTNDSVNDVKRANSDILTLADATSFVAGGAITGDSDNGNDGVGVVRHKEGNNILVETTSGSWVAGNGVDDAATYASDNTTISAAYDNELMIDIIFSNYSGSYTTAVGEALSTDMKEVGFDVASTTVTAKTRKLKAKWKIELEEDLQAVHGISAEQLLSQIASEEIVLEMNREFINLIGTSATAVTTYDFVAGDGRWEIEQNAELVAKIGRERKNSYLQNKRGQSNWCIATSGVLNALENSKFYVPQQNVGLNGADPVQNAKVGSLNGMAVYTDIHDISGLETITLGYKGSSEVDAGIFYAPYIPLKIGKGYGEEDNQPRLFFSTRYGVVNNPFGAENYFRKFTVSNLPT
jgi:hypothetical protein